MLEVRGLSRRVEDRTLFEGVDFALPPGERLVVRGASGSGKSLMLRALAALDPVDGAVTLDGKDARAWGASAWRARVMFVPQAAPAFGGTGEELWQRVCAFASRGEVGERPDVGLPAGAWTREWASLSGGEQLRALLAIAIGLRPEVLLVDEPTAPLDAESAGVVEALLRARRAVVVAHVDGLAERLGARELVIA